ncbi:tRNA 4-thiouridine(8) synthase ThiI [Marinococcus halophilus]|uniref:Probable tRNA sulfurtransferase n=1 Tax=Marinococcus halophilus TaxID=1371 RepID=A0A510Y6Q7_MARHA|nr:tRNA uracil 4-sulfurtransferase ThiI [Marinococcus halophilus]OZT79937.1 tRNA 4-thiouridine(8) synthase ThiI [Marinococcus halophilus]GEK58147.1 putative tRNA sulfurtransferase [Marinococcus halophilus]
MREEYLLIRFGELALKGKNRKEFERQLRENIDHAVKGFPSCEVRRTYGRIAVNLLGEPAEKVIEAVKPVFGISSISYARKADLTEEEIQQTAHQMFSEYEGRKTTFKVEARRSNKDFPIHSTKLAPSVGSYILHHTEEVEVDVKDPDVTVEIDVREQGAYVSCGRIPGAGGLPTGTSGKVVSMLSGGIDSPAAAYLAMKRGVTIEAVHFHSPPYTNERAKQKVEDIVRALSRFGGNINLHVVPFTRVQEAIRSQVPDDHTMTITRRAMLEIVTKIAEQEGAKAVINGESLGQVASQTLESMNVINQVTNIPVLRPLIAMDKEEIISIAKRIGTYDISVRPYEDCCTVFQPESPATKPKIGLVYKYEKRLNKEELFNEAVAETKTISLSNVKSEKEEFEDLL